MSKVIILTGVILGFLILSGAITISMYNGLISSDETVKTAWADVESSYQRRIDLIPNLVATVEGASSFEADTLATVTQLRAQAVSAQQTFASATNAPDKIAAAQNSESALSRLLVIVENYPDLKATANYADLQVQLEGTENRISVARDRYNDAVRVYNVKIRSFPTNMLAGFAGLSVATPFEASAGASSAPTVIFK